MDERRYDYPDILRRLDELSIDFKEWRTEIRGMVYGNGDDGRPGLVLRIDRLEQRQAATRRGMAVVLTALSGLVVELIHRWFFR